MKLKGKKILILEGRHKGVEGYVIYEDETSVAIAALGMFGDYGHFGKYYALKTTVKEMK